MERIAWRALHLARQGAPHTLRIEIKVTTLDELAQALDVDADIELLDNMEIADLRKAVIMTDGRALVDASGGVTLESVTEIAAIGAGLISGGALTRSAPRSTSAWPSGSQKLVRTGRHTTPIVNDRCHKGTEIWHIGPKSTPSTAFHCTYCHRGLR